MERRVLIGVTGASGVIYAERLVQALLNRVERIYIVVTDAGAEVVRHELTKHEAGFSLLEAVQGKIPESARSIIRMLRNDDFFAPVASGSSVPTDMVVLPCSMGTLARIAGGMSTNLLERAADVVLKERKRMILCPREMPLNSIHLRNMLGLADMGACILPPSPAFYQKPKTLDDAVNFVVGRVLEVMELSHDLYPRWNARMV